MNAYPVRPWGCGACHRQHPQRDQAERCCTFREPPPPSDPTVPLPDGLPSRSVGTMQPTETGWAVPWALTVDTDGNGWLEPTFYLLPRPAGEARMPISRRPDGYHVWPPDPVDIREPTEGLPVAVIHWKATG